MINKLLFVSVFVSVSLFAAEMSEADINKSKSIAGSMKKGLGGMLKQKLEKEGPVAAFSFCADNAIPATKKIAEENNVTIKRVSTKLRNPALNTPDSLDNEALAEFSKYKNENEAPKYLVLKDKKTGVARFYEPMYVMGMCLACHGEPSKMPEGVKSQISAKYPNDKAIDYKTGDFRGLIAIELKK